MKPDTLHKILKLVASADATELEAIQDVVHVRWKSLRHAERVANKALFKVGDKIRLKGLKPQYLNGTPGEIVDTHPRGFIVQLPPDADQRATRRFGSRPIVPANCLEKI